MTDFVTDLARELAEEVTRIEREKTGKALTEDETRTLKAERFLRQIAPYLFEQAARPR